MKFAPALICFAVKEESVAFTRLASARADLEVLVTGMGRENAERAVRARLAEFTPALVLTCGLAGGLNSDLATGTIVFDATDHAALETALVAAGARRVRFHCAEQVVSTAAQKRALRQATGADAVEMESQSIRAICRDRRIPSATVRVILDAAGEDLPLDFNQVLTADQRLDPGKLAMALARSPGKIPGLLRLRQQTQAAARRLAECLMKVLSV